MPTRLLSFSKDIYCLNGLISPIVMFFVYDDAFWLKNLKSIYYMKHLLFEKRDNNNVSVLWILYIFNV